MGQNIKQVKGKIIFKHQTAAEWDLSNNGAGAQYVPDVGERILYDPDETHPYTREKFGDGEHIVKDLPFSNPSNIIDGNGTNSVLQKHDSSKYTDAKPDFQFVSNTAEDATIAKENIVGNFAAAFGGYSAATGKRSFAVGTTTWAAGDYSFASGNNAKAEGPNSHVEGRSTWAASINAHAEGDETIASGNNSHSEGIGTKALSRGSHAEGELTVAGINNTDDHWESGSNAHAEGYKTEATGWSSHAEGNQTKSKGNSSHAEGLETEARYEGSHAEGAYSKATVNFAHAEGYATLADTVSAHSEGWYAKVSEYHGAGHAEGIGTFVGGNLTWWGDGSLEHEEGGGHAEGAKTKAMNHAAHAEGIETESTGKGAHSEGVKTVASGYASHAEGNGTEACAIASHAAGSYTIATRESQTVVGQWNAQDDEAYFIVGNGYQAKDNYGWDLGDPTRRNALAVKYTGDVYAAGNVYANGQKLVDTTEIKALAKKDEVSETDFDGALSAKFTEAHSQAIAAYNYATQALMEKLDKTGGNITGNLAVSGNLTVAGKSIESNLENVVTPQNTITLRKGATTALLNNEYTGFIAEKYDGTNTGMLVFDKDGTAYVGDEGDVQPLATRASSNELTDGHVLTWNAGKQKLVDGGSLSSYTTIEAYNALLSTVDNKANKSELVVTTGTGANSAKTGNNTASGDCSFAGGQGTVADADNSYAGGLGSTTTLGHYGLTQSETVTTYYNDTIKETFGDTFLLVFWTDIVKDSNNEYANYIRLGKLNTENKYVDIPVAGDYIDELTFTYCWGPPSNVRTATISGVYTEHGVYVCMAPNGSGYLNTPSLISGGSFKIRKTTVSESFIPSTSAFAHGTYLIADGDSQAVVGKYNKVDHSALFIVGNGTNEPNRKNAMAVSKTGEVALCSGGSLKIGETSINENELKAIKSSSSSSAQYSSYSTNTYVEIPFGTNVAFSPAEGPSYTSINQETAMIGVIDYAGYMSYKGIIGQITAENADSLTGLFVVEPSLVYRDSEMFYEAYGSNVVYSGTITKGQLGYSGNVTMYYLKEAL